ncbi:MAG: cell division protein FtsH, partial [Spirochaetaceae bacterium]|nr:cell division protein FtsH [Spirochaetaceae bacterium]
HNFLTKRDMLNEIDSYLGGRAAEEIMLGEVSTGASNDIARATDIIKRMITDYGMSDKFKNITLGKGVLGNRGGEPAIVREFSEETQKFIDEEMARIMEERYQHVLFVLREHKQLLEYIANRLIEIETMDGKEFAEIIKAEADLSQKVIAQNNAVAEEKPAESAEADANEQKPEQSETVAS